MSLSLYTLYTNKGCNDQRSQATTSSVSGLKKILKNHTFKQSFNYVRFLVQNV
jgi:hypothetical protein